MSKDKFPPISRELLEALERRFADRLPDTVVPEGKLGELVGQQAVLRFLRFEFNRQQQNVLET